ncbi:MAG TPA: tRNA lysidine(34) synthetase TilS [Methylomirabilota bacterium]|nr:tRNA lysidine(34) synthetase TilS [Methylomirabilota bacterium]
MPRKPSSPPQDPILAKVRANIIERNLLAKGERIVVAVSGGLDSMALLRILFDLQPEFGWSIHVAHFDHRLRGKASSADARFVEKQAALLGCKATIGSGDVKAHAGASGISIEMAARELRREFLATVAADCRSNSILLAHHADDQIELFFLRLLRGAGSEGLRGMLWKAQSEAKSDLHYIRPFLDISRAELESFAAARKLPFREDASNATMDYERNRVRHQLLPLLGRLTARDIRAPLLRVMDLLSAEGDYLGQQARVWLTKPADFQKLHLALQRRVIVEQLLDLSLTPDFELVEALRASPPRKITVAARLSVRRDLSGALQLIEDAPLVVAADSLEIEVSEPGETQFASLDVSWVTIPGNAYRPRTPDTEVFDAAAVGARFRLRHWQPGDRFQPIGLPKAAKLQDLFTNAKVPAAQRRKRVLAEAADGRILWVEGLRIADFAKVTPATSQLLLWQWKRLPTA